MGGHGAEGDTLTVQSATEAHSIALGSHTDYIAELRGKLRGRWFSESRLLLETRDTSLPREPSSSGWRMDFGDAESSTLPIGTLQVERSTVV